MAGGPNTVPVRPDLANVTSDLLALRLFCVSPERKKASSFRSAPEGCDDHLSRRGERGGQDDAQPCDRGAHGCSCDCRGLGSLRTPITGTTAVVFGEAGGTLALCAEEC